MSTPFIHDDFLLETSAARELYHRFAAPEPIIDFHNHLSPAQIAGNHCFGDLQEAWLSGDHYKWRALRTNGVPEHFITGSASPVEKFQAWARTVPYTLRNPLYHWTHLELARHFDMNVPLNEATASAVWEEANAKLSGLRVHDILRLHRVKVLCTTDDPADPLDHHRAILGSGLSTQVFPTFRTDSGYEIDDLESCDAGVTGCDVLVAQTGGVMVSVESAGGRALSVLPPHHIVIARTSQMVPDLTAAFEHAKGRYGKLFPSFMSFITGPSRTGDIERILVLGAHGPKRLTVIVLD